MYHSELHEQEKVNDFGIDKRRIFSISIDMLEKESMKTPIKVKDVPCLASYLKLCSFLFILPFHVEFNKTEETWLTQKSTKRIVSNYIFRATNSNILYQVFLNLVFC